jgi:hypothetical protein
MSEHSLCSFFEAEAQQWRALEALGDWFNPQELDLYDASQRAFDPSTSAHEAFRHFKKIYDDLASPNWQVFRPRSLADCWQPQQIFDMIKREFPEFSWCDPLNLLNFSTSGTGPHLDLSLAKMQGIKPNLGYPIMTVSKSSTSTTRHCSLFTTPR